jgi:hypothetical protein
MTPDFFFRLGAFVFFAAFFLAPPFFLAAIYALLSSCSRSGFAPAFRDSLAPEWIRRARLGKRSAFAHMRPVYDEVPINGR